VTGLTIGFWNIEGFKGKLGNIDYRHWVQERRIIGTAESWARRQSEVRSTRIRQKKGPESRREIQTLADWEEISNAITNTETAAKEVL
jgi:hypothetical protein